MPQYKKLQLFDRGAAAFAHVFPDGLAHLGPEASPHYVCPTCPEPDATGKNYRVQLFPRSAVLSRALTAEHVPPEAFGGRELVLTCQPCNNDIGGSQLEAHARRLENSIDLLRGVSKRRSKVRLTAGGHYVNAKLGIEDNILKVDMPPWKKNANDPRAVEGFREALLRRSTINISFDGDTYSPRRANVTWLRHAYLVLFAIAGYRYIFSAGLSIVRKQIKEPDTEHISTFLAALPGEHFWSERLIIKVQEPEWLQSWAVQIGRYVALLPRPGDIEFYARLAEDSNIHKGLRFTGELIEWPTEPFFGLEQPELWSRSESG